MRFVTVCTVAALALAGCGGERDAAGDADSVFKLRLETFPEPTCEDVSCATVEHVHWIAPEQGWWRMENEDGSGYRTIRVFAHGRYSTGTEVRLGSPEFVDAHAPPSLPAVKERDELAVGDTLELQCGQARCTFRVEESMTLAEAEERRVFAIYVTSSNLLHRERDPGAPPTLPVQAYWFGPEFAGRKAFTAVELRTDDGVIHITAYGHPEEIAAGETHMYPGREIPEREIQLTSRPVTDPLVKREIALLKARGPGRTLVLGDGELVVAYRHAIITGSTLVRLGGASAPDVDFRRVGSALRPL
jgi:hypothetical protein